eukprot:3941140-Rhodomonas_salina.4
MARRRIVPRPYVSTGQGIGSALVPAQYSPLVPVSQRGTAHLYRRRYQTGHRRIGRAVVLSDVALYQRYYHEVGRYGQTTRHARRSW